MALDLTDQLIMKMFDARTGYCAPTSLSQVGRALSRLCFAKNRTVAFSTEESRLLSTVYKSRLVH
jgi:hypothetical protein